MRMRITLNDNYSGTKQRIGSPFFLETRVTYMIVFTE